MKARQPAGPSRLVSEVCVNGVNQVNWVKSSADALLVENQRAAEGKWTVLDTDNNSPFLEARASLAARHPDVRRDRGRYIVNDEPVGNNSAVASVMTSP